MSVSSASRIHTLETQLLYQLDRSEQRKSSLNFKLDNLLPMLRKKESETFCGRHTSINSDHGKSFEGYKLNASFMNTSQTLKENPYLRHMLEKQHDNPRSSRLNRLSNRKRSQVHFLRHSNFIDKFSYPVTDKYPKKLTADQVEAQIDMLESLLRDKKKNRNSMTSVMNSRQDLKESSIMEEKVVENISNENTFNETIRIEKDPAETLPLQIKKVFKKRTRYLKKLCRFYE